MASKYGFFPAAGTDYSRGQEPEIARRLRRLGRALHLRIIGISGFRTPAHSVAVGGFPNDPHTQGRASDSPGVEGVSEPTLRRYGLTRPFPGAQEADHIQLLGSKGGTTTVRPRGARPDGPAQWLKQGGWPSNLIPVMVAIGGAESGWNVAAESPPNDNGTVDEGWLQINSVHGYDSARLRSDPVYTARAGYQVYKKQGLAAWSTYNSGAYKGFMGQRPNTSGSFGRTRPGGDTPPDSSGVDNELAAYWATPAIPGLGIPEGIPLPDPITLFKGAAKEINSVGDFLKWISWLFHPLNILRATELLIGFPLIIMGVVLMAKVWGGSAGEAPMRLLGDAASFTPPGRALRVAKGAKVGKGLAKSQVKRDQTKRAIQRGKRGEEQKQSRKTLKRGAREDRRRGEEIPF